MLPAARPITRRTRRQASRSVPVLTLNSLRGFPCHRSAAMILDSDADLIDNGPSTIQAPSIKGGREK